MTDPCPTCAVRPGTDAAVSPSTQLTFRLCVLSGREFECHERPGACAGWLAAMKVRSAEPDWKRVCAGDLLEIHLDSVHGLAITEEDGLARIFSMVERICAGEATR